MDELWMLECPECGGMNSTVEHETIHKFRDTLTGRVYENPIGYLVCPDCGCDWYWQDPSTANDEDLTIADSHPIDTLWDDFDDD